MKQHAAEIIAGFFTGIVFFAVLPWIFSGAAPGLAGYDTIMRFFPAIKTLFAIALVYVSYIAVSTILFLIYFSIRFFCGKRVPLFRQFLFFALGITASYFLECAILGALFVFSSPTV